MLTSTSPLGDPLDQRLLAHLGDDGFARDHLLAQHHARLRIAREVDVDPAAEADQPDALARCDGIARLHERHDPACHEAGDLGEAHAPAVGAFDEDVLAFVLFARLVEIGVEELAGDIDHPLDRPRHRRAIDVDVEHAHENRDACHRLFAEPFAALPVIAHQFGGRRDLFDQRDEAVGRGNDVVLALRGDANRIAEEGEHAQRQEGERPGQGFPSEEGEYEAQRKHGEAVFAAFGMDRGPAPAGFAIPAVIDDL